jgi:hypothetical protein
MVFGIFNLGASEIVVLLAIASIVVLVILLTRRQGRADVPDRIAALEAENQRLREELDKLKKDRT